MQWIGKTISLINATVDDKALSYFGIACPYVTLADDSSGIG